ncbi:MAG: hypothetical protein ABIJ30_06385 [bacterium]
MDMKKFSKYLKYKSFDESIHYIRQISLERTADIESAEKVIQQEDNQQEKKAA